MLRNQASARASADEYVSGSILPTSPTQAPTQLDKSSSLSATTSKMEEVHRMLFNELTEGLQVLRAGCLGRFLLNPYGEDSGHVVGSRVEPAGPWHPCLVCFSCHCFMGATEDSQLSMQAFTSFLRSFLLFYILLCTSLLRAQDRDGNPASDIFTEDRCCGESSLIDTTLYFETIWNQIYLVWQGPI